MEDPLKLANEPLAHVSESGLQDLGLSRDEKQGKSLLWKLMFLELRKAFQVLKAKPRLNRLMLLKDRGSRRDLLF